MSKSVNVDFVTRQIEVDTDGKEYYVSAAVAAKDAEQSMINAQNAANAAEVAANEVKEIYNDGNLTPVSDLLGGLGTKLKRWGTIFANKVFASNLPIVYNSVAEMKADTLLWEGMSTKTLGYYSPNDGGGAYYLIREKLETDIDDGGSLHELSNGLVAELIIENGTVNVKQFGAVGDGITDDTSFLQQAIDYCSQHAKTCKISSGVFKITSTIDVPSRTRIIGTAVLPESSTLINDSKQYSKIVFYGEGVCLNCGGQSSSSMKRFVRAKDILLVYAGESTNAIGLNFKYSASFYYENIQVMGFYMGITSRTSATDIGVYSWTGEFNSCIAINNHYGILLGCNAVNINYGYYSNNKECNIAINGHDNNINGPGVELSRGILAEWCEGLNITASWESNANADAMGSLPPFFIKITISQAVTINAVRIATWTPDTTIVDVYSCRGINIIGFSIKGGSKLSGTAIKLKSVNGFNIIGGSFHNITNGISLESVMGTILNPMFDDVDSPILTTGRHIRCFMQARSEVISSLSNDAKMNCDFSTIDVSKRKFGDSSYRPSGEYIGQSYFDTTIGKIVWWNGSNWVDSTGTSV